MLPNVADRNLLFGILALQMDFISRDALIGAMHAWVLDKTKPLGQILVEQGGLPPARRDLLEPLVAAHLDMHGGDPEKSLAALAVPPQLRQQLSKLADVDVQASLTHLPTPTTNGSRPPPDSTTAYQPAPSALRYHILRPHARGGLGEVFVALDEELRREVALKEIDAEHADDPHSRGRFVREAEITGGLEHPGIVPVYGLGQYGDGRPFYAMRFIQGETLKEAIARYHGSPHTKQEGDAARSPEFDLRTLLTRFIGVCNSIAYAHSRGVIHRDIKPSNIMLGKYGETLIVDWGLAKALSEAPARTSADGLTEQALIARLTDIGETQVGSALGTPAYMSPEQAAGRVDLLGPASDIYSLGATLYTVLAGRPPIEGKETAEVLRKAQRGEWLPPRQVKSDIPRALEAICRKAMALKPEERYATALELAADVEHWLADEPIVAYAEPWPVRARRWLRRHQSLAAATAATVLVAAMSLAAATVLLAAANDREREARAAEEQTAGRERQARERAETNFRLARQAVDGLTRVSESPELKALAMEPLRRELLGQAKDFYGELAEQQADEPNLQAERGRAHLRLADITEALDDRARAVELARAAQHIFEDLCRASPDVADYQDGLASALTVVGRNYEEAKQYPAARQALERAAGIRDRLREQLPGRRDYRFRLAGTLDDLGVLYLRGLGDAPQGVAALERACSLCRQLMDEAPGDPEYPSQLARTLSDLGYLESLDHNFARGVAIKTEAVTLLEQLVKQHPKVADYQFRLAVAFTHLAASHENLRQPHEAKAAAAKAMAVADRLASAHPDVPDYQKHLALVRVNYAVALAQAGEHGRAASEVESAVAKQASGAAFYNAACAYCLCSAAAEHDTNLPAAERNQLVARYLDRAVGLLHEAAKTGFFKQAQGISDLQSDHDLDPLRQRADFKQLLAGVLGPGSK